jgi:ssDNA thymidine ADP-ribosyltransferase, DarT
MALRASFIERHVRYWEDRLRGPVYPYRFKWPSRLFHHAPLANAVKILEDGSLRSRSDPKNRRQQDVAAAGVIDARLHAHQYARLYFRPRTPTQFHIEGIRKTGECRYGETAHAPILVMFVFDAQRVLSRPDICFCDRNMQQGSAEPSNSEEYFSEIPFGKVYHEGGIGDDRTIIEHRCAEVLAPSPLRLEDTLQWIYCRSEAERDTLVLALGANAERWVSSILVSEDIKVFQREYAFVQEITLANHGIIFRLNPRSDRAKVDVAVRAWNAKGVEVVKFRNRDMAAAPDFPAKRWRIDTKLSVGRYRVQVDLEGQLAFFADLRLGPSLF